jgi:hypothetical protein
VKIPIRFGRWPQRIGLRLALGFGISVVLMLVALAQAIFQIHTITGVTQRFATGDMQRLLRVQALSFADRGRRPCVDPADQCTARKSGARIRGCG